MYRALQAIANRCESAAAQFAQCTQIVQRSWEPHAEVGTGENYDRVSHELLLFTCSCSTGRQLCGQQPYTLAMSQLDRLQYMQTCSVTVALRADLASSLRAPCMMGSLA